MTTTVHWSRRDLRLRDNTALARAAAGTDHLLPIFVLDDTILADPDGDYVRHWVPELAEVPARWIHGPWQLPAKEATKIGLAPGRNYAERIVRHEDRRPMALAMYGAARH